MMVGILIILLGIGLLGWLIIGTHLIRRRARARRAAALTAFMSATSLQDITKDTQDPRSDL